MAQLVWITGAQGFIGSHLAAKLAKANQRIIGFTRTGATGANNASMVATYGLTIDGLAAAVKDHGIPDKVYHLAGAATVGQSLDEPHRDFQSNVGTTETLLETLRMLGKPVPLVLSSSAAVYGDGHAAPIKTGAALAPGSPYGHHKVIAEQLVRAHAQSFGLPVIICRLFSIYGPGLRKQLVFDVCNRLSNATHGTTLELGGTGDERRDWLHIADAVDGLSGLIDPSPGEVICHNLARGVAITNREFASELANAWNAEHKISFSGKSRQGDPFSLVADSDSLPKDFSPRVGIKEGLKQTVDWFRKHHKLQS